MALQVEQQSPMRSESGGDDFIGPDGVHIADALFARHSKGSSHIRAGESKHAS